jgi:hypothetical protein
MQTIEMAGITEARRSIKIRQYRDKKATQAM